MYKLPAFNHALWNDFISSRDNDEYCHNWIGIQCQLIPDAVQGVVFLADPATGAFRPVSSWPRSGGAPERLKEIAERVIEQKCGLLIELDAAGASGSPQGHSFGAAYPFSMDGLMKGLVAVELRADTEEALSHAMGQLQWGTGWLELMFRRGQAKEGERLFANLKSAVDLMALVLSESSFKGAAMAFVTQLAVILRCDRASIAFVVKNHARIQALSHSAQIEKRMNLNRAIELAMDEAVVQRRDVLYPPPPERGILIVRNHERLAKDHGAGCIYTLPFYGEGRYYGAMTVERPEGQEFSEEEINLCRSVAALIFPVLETKRKNDRHLILKTADSIRIQSERLIGAGYAGRKVLLIMLLLLAVFFSFKTWDYRVSGQTTLEGRVRRSIVSPFEGYVKEAFVRSGDMVEEGTVMCSLDDRDLRLERINLISRSSQYRKQYQEATATHNRAEAEIIKAQLDQTAAQLDLIESRIERTRVTAPFKGIVLSGDLSQRLGGSTEMGEVLFEIAPLDSYRIIIEVDERRITDLKPGQEGRMILSALPEESFGFVVEKITPISSAKEGLNYFRVEAGTEEVSERLRPGMTGIGKIYIERRKLIDILTRDLRDWIRLRAWSWWP